MEYHRKTVRQCAADVTSLKSFFRIVSIFMKNSPMTWRRALVLLHFTLCCLENAAGYFCKICRSAPGAFAGRRGQEFSMDAASHQQMPFSKTDSKSGKHHNSCYLKKTEKVGGISNQDSQV